MNIFKTAQIQSAPVYAPLMHEINELYSSLNSPAELAANRAKTTIGNPFDASREWDASSIGDWGGLEEQVADKIRGECSVVAAAIDLGIHYYHATPEWVEFTEQAQILFHEFNACRAFERLCDNADNYC